MSGQSGYNASNSLSPMMFKKTGKKDKEGTRNERWRSKSVEHVYDINPAYNQGKTEHQLQRGRAATSQPPASQSVQQQPWKELDKLKGLAPVVACVLPSMAMDFVASSLLAIGATPLIPEGEK